jgi:hypothetical protein
VGRYIALKTIVVFALGVALGIGAMSYRDDAKVRAATNAHIDSAVSQAATSAHQALTK